MRQIIARIEDRSPRLACGPRNGAEKTAPRPGRAACRPLPGEAASRADHLGDGADLLSAATLPGHPFSEPPSRAPDGRPGNGEDPSGIPRKARPSVTVLGPAALDAALGGGLPSAGLAEIRSAETRDWGVSTGFALALLSLFGRRGTACGPVVWIAPDDARLEGGNVWMPGLAGLAGPDLRLVLVRPRRLVEALWAAETAAASGAAGAVILEIRGNPARLGLTESRRLHLRARERNRPLLLLRQAGAAETSAAPVRFLVGPAPAAPRPLAGGTVLAGSLGRPAFSVTLEKARLPGPLTFTLEWNPDECRFDIRIPPAGDPAGRSFGPADPGHRLSPPAHRPDHPEEKGAVLAFERTG